MTSAHGRPTAAELIAAVAEFLETDVRESTAGQVNFHSRVAANALRMVERELLADAEAADGVAGALARGGIAGLAHRTGLPWRIDTELLGWQHHRERRDRSRRNRWCD